MPLNIGELFVKLGVKGVEQSAKGAESVAKSLGGVASSGLAAKAAVVGLVYGLQRLTGAAGAQGMELKQFADSTGLSADALQRWQYAARQYGVAGQEVMSTTRGIQNAMTNMLMGKGAPEGMGLLANTVGFDTKKARDTFYVLEKLQKFAQSGVPTDMAANVLRSFGVSESMFAFLKNNSVDLQKIAPSAIYSEKQIQALAKVDVAWENLINRFKMFSGGFVAKFGLEGISKLSNAFTFLTKAANDLDKLTTKMPELKVAAVSAGVAIAAAFGPITTAVAALIYLLDYVQKKGGIENALKATIGTATEEDYKKFVESRKKEYSTPESSFSKNTRAFLHSIFGAPEFGAPDTKKMAAPSIGRMPQSAESKTTNNTVAPVMNFYGVKDAEESAALFQRKLNETVRQMAVQGQGS